MHARLNILWSKHGSIAYSGVQATPAGRGPRSGCGRSNVCKRRRIGCEFSWRSHAVRRVRPASRRTHRVSRHNSDGCVCAGPARSAPAASARLGPFGGACAGRLLRPLSSLERADPHRPRRGARRQRRQGLGLPGCGRGDAAGWSSTRARPRPRSVARSPHRCANSRPQNFSTHGRSSISQDHALRGCCNTCR